MRTKYGSISKQCKQAHVHQSKKEAAACNILHYLQKTGKILRLEVQPTFTLQPSFTGVDGKKVRAIKYTADFSFYDLEYKRHRIIDIKGFKTPVYRIKKKLFDYKMHSKNLTVEESI